MKLLLDTHVILWAAAGSDRLSDDLRAALENEANSLLFSAASIWEVAIKSALGRDDFRVEAEALRRGLLQSGYIEVPITGEHAVGVAGLPAVHQDPFDRMLVAQAIAEGAPLVTSDDRLRSYPVAVIMV